MTASWLVNVNTALNVLMFVAVIVAGIVFVPRAWRAAESKAREEEMQRTINAYKQRVDSLEPQVESLLQEVKGCREMAAKWEARYNEQSRYTAKDSLERVVREMAASRQAMVTGFESQTELLLKALEMQSKTLERVGGDPRLKS